MSMASMSNPSLYSSPPFPRSKPTKQSLSFLSVFVHSTSRLTLSSHDHPSAVAAGGQATARPLALTVRVSSSATEPQPSKSGDGEDAGGQEGEVYEVELDKPYGLRFFKGRDGGTYIDAIAPEGAADKTGLFTVGDKVIATRLSLWFLFYLAITGL